MEFSYWELKHWFKDVDFTIAGSGITGLNCALKLRQKYPKSKILVLEKGFLPQGASTKNAGFACFGSVSELLDDLKTHSEEEIVNLAEKRWTGLKLLRKKLGESAIKYKQNGGYEVFLDKNKKAFEECFEKMAYLNKLLKPIFKKDVFEICKNTFGFYKVYPELIKNGFEGQLDTGKMMLALLRLVVAADIRILNGISLKAFSDSSSGVRIETGQFEFTTKKLFIATNGFASEVGIENVKPARAQVLITERIPELSINGTFHLEQGYYYFRNIDDRILFGGGRNMAPEEETTTQFGETQIIQNKLETLLREVILPGTHFKIEHRWSGIMGIGNKKSPVLKTISPNVFCGVRLGGMGVAIGALTGEELALFAN